MFCRCEDFSASSASSALRHGQAQGLLLPHSCLVFCSPPFSAPRRRVEVFSSVVWSRLRRSVGQALPPAKDRPGGQASWPVGKVGQASACLPARRPVPPGAASPLGGTNLFFVHP